MNNQPATAMNRSEILSVDEKISTVQRRCRSFFSTAIKQMQSRFNFDDEVYDIAEFLNPVNARSCKPPSLAPIFLRFPFLRDSCDIIKADAEWRTQRSLSYNLFGVESNDEIKNLTVQKYWDVVLEVKTVLDEVRFPELTKVISLFFCLPASNATAERFFSSMKQTKSDRRGKSAHNHIFPDELLEVVSKVKSNAVVDPGERDGVK